MKTYLKMFLLALLGTGVAVISSCSKDATLRDGKTEMQAGGDVTAPEDEFLEQKIMAFLQQCDFYAAHPGMKSVAMLHKRDAAWLLEAAMNYSFGFPHLSYSRFRVDSCVVSLTKTGPDSAAYSAVAVCLQQLEDSVRYFYSRLAWKEKNVVVTDICLSGDPAAGDLLLKAWVICGRPGPASVPFSNPYDATDYWFYGGLAGKCGAYFPSFFGSDAAREIEKYQYWFSQSVPPAPGCHVYHTDIEQVIVQGNAFVNAEDSLPGDNWCDHYLFFSDPSLPNYHECLHPGEMWHYLAGLYRVVTDPDKGPAGLSVPGKDFVSVQLTACLSLGNVLSHRALIRYGNRHISCDPHYPKAPLAL